MRTTTLTPRSRRLHPLARAVALMVIAGTLGAWAAFLLFNWDDSGHHRTVAAPQHHSQSAVGESTPAADSGHQHGDGMAISVAYAMAASPDMVRACVGSSLEPFDGSMAQLLASGPEDAAERMRFCVFEIIIGHGDDATMTDLESHRTHFETCFGDLMATEPADKARAVEDVSACILAGLAPS